jgi:hypothetical protein
MGKLLRVVLERFGKEANTDCYMPFAYASRLAAASVLALSRTNSNI